MKLIVWQDLEQFRLKFVYLGLYMVIFSFFILLDVCVAYNALPYHKKSSDCAHTQISPECE